MQEYKPFPGDTLEGILSKIEKADYNHLRAEKFGGEELKKLTRITLELEIDRAEKFAKYYLQEIDKAISATPQPTPDA